MTGFRKAATLVAALTFAACSPEIDRIYEVDTVRILAVQKTVERGDPSQNGGSYARPGEEVNFHMLWDAGSRNRAAGIEVERMWIKGCVNPKGDTYTGCADFLLQGAANPQQFIDQYVVKREKKARVHPEDTIAVPMPGKEALRPAANEMPEYALYMMFFAACAGEIEFTAENISIQDGRLPITCTRNGELLGADDFVVGYSSVYIFEDAKNENPLIDALQFWKDPERAAPPYQLFPINRHDPPACAGVGCFNVAEPTTREDIENLCTQGLCVEPCADDGDIDECPAHGFKAYLTDAEGGPNRERDTVSPRNPLEQLTVHYHADRGKMRSDVRVIRDGSGAWNIDNLTNYYAPAEPGFVRVWVVVRDNRGGVDWMSMPLYVR